MSLRTIPEITAEMENFRVEQAGCAPGVKMGVIRRDPVEPVPVGTYVAVCFRVTGYDQDCDGSLMARLINVDLEGEETGWQVTGIGLHPGSELVVDHPSDLQDMVEFDGAPGGAEEMVW